MIAFGRKAGPLSFILLALLLVACVTRPGPRGWAGPVVADDLLIVSQDHSRLAAFRLPDYEKAWEFPSGELRGVERPCGRPEVQGPEPTMQPLPPLQGLYGTPVAAEGRLFVGDYSGFLYVLELETGRLLWQCKTGGPIVASPLVEGRTVYLGSSDGRLYALEAATGRELWPPFTAKNAIWSAPVEAGGIVYFASMDGLVYALDARTGEPRWPKPFRARGGIAAPLAAAEGLVLAGGLDRHLYALDAQTGEVRWTFRAKNWFWSEPLVEGGTVYVGALDGRVYALELKTGKPRWPKPFRARAPVRARPALTGGVLVVADREGNLYGLNPRTGEELWTQPLNREVLADLEADKGNLVVYVSTSDGALFRVGGQDGRIQRIGGGGS